MQDWISVIVNILAAAGTIAAVVGSLKKGAKTAEEKAVLQENRFTKIEGKVEGLEKNQASLETNIYADFKEYKQNMKEEFEKQSKEIQTIQHLVKTIIEFMKGKN